MLGGLKLYYLILKYIYIYILVYFKYIPSLEIEINMFNVYVIDTFYFLGHIITIM